MEIEKIDLSFYLEPPELSVDANLSISPLAPLSMVSAQPGSYFRSELAPTDEMLYGLIENALGWHFGDDLRKELFKSLTKKANKKYKENPDFQGHPWLLGNQIASGSGFQSLLQHHLRFEFEKLPDPEVTYDDLWSMLLRDTGQNFAGGSRHYDYTLEELINRLRSDDPALKVDLGERANVHLRVSLEDAKSAKGISIHYSSIREAYPMYYVSPKKRGYVIPNGPYSYRASCTPSVAKIIQLAVESPEAPLYLGSNDGWVHLKWEVL